MPKSSLIADWTEDLDVNKLDAREERFYLRLKTKTDDYGRYHADPLLLKSRLFPLKKDIRETDILCWLAACEKADLIRFYVGQDSRRYLEVLNHRQRKTWMKSDHPPPEGQIPLLIEEPNKKNSAREYRSRSRGEEKHATEKPAARPSCATPSPVLKEKKPETTKKEPEPIWKLLSDEKTLTDRIREEAAKQQPDKDLIVALKSRRVLIREQMKG